MFEDLFVGTGVLDGPRNIKNLMFGFVGVCKFVDVILCKLFVFVRTVEDACPYDEPQILCVDRTLNKNLSMKK